MGNRIKHISIKETRSSYSDAQWNYLHEFFDSTISNGIRNWTNQRQPSAHDISFQCAQPFLKLYVYIWNDFAMVSATSVVFIVQLRVLTVRNIYTCTTSFLSPSKVFNSDCIVFDHSSLFVMHAHLHLE